MDYILNSGKLSQKIAYDRLHNTKTISSSGNLNGGTLALQFRNRDNEAWQADASVTLLADEHINGILTITARQHQVIVTGAGGSLDVALVIG